MSQVREVEQAWGALIEAVADTTTAAASGVATAGTDRSVSCAASGWSATANAWRWAVLAFTSGANAGRFRVVTSYAVADGAAVFSWRQALPAAVAAEDAFTVSFAPLAGATVFMRRIIPASLQAAEMPAVFVAATRSRSITSQGIGNQQGSRRAVLEVRTDLVSPWDDTVANALLADQLFEQVDQLWQNTTGLAGVAQVVTPERDAEIAAFGELDRGSRVYWSTLWMRFGYPI